VGADAGEVDVGVDLGREHLAEIGMGGGRGVKWWGKTEHPTFNIEHSTSKGMQRRRGDVRRKRGNIE
jgi:hypothetical protein